MRIRLNCLSCGHPMDLGDAYEDYAGEVRCWGCQAVLEVTLQEGKLKTMRRGGGDERAARSSDRGGPGPAPRAGAAGHETR